MFNTKNHKPAPHFKLDPSSTAQALTWQRAEQQPLNRNSFRSQKHMSLSVAKHRVGDTQSCRGTKRLQIHACWRWDTGQSEDRLQIYLCIMYIFYIYKGLTSLYEVLVHFCSRVTLLTGETVLDVAVSFTPHRGLQRCQPIYLLHLYHKQMLSHRFPSCRSRLKEKHSERRSKGLHVLSTQAACNFSINSLTGCYHRPVTRTNRKTWSQI